MDFRYTHFLQAVYAITFITVNYDYQAAVFIWAKTFQEKKGLS